MNKPSRIHIGSDHAGYDFKLIAMDFLKQEGISVIDHGPLSKDSVDYPDFADKVCSSLNEDSQAMGLLICGSGQGMCIRANKYPYIRAALCYNEEVARLSRQHNDANVICLGARMQPTDELIKILKTFINQQFEGGRHQLRVEKLHRPTSS